MTAILIKLPVALEKRTFRDTLILLLVLPLLLLAGEIYRSIVSGYSFVNNDFTQDYAAGVAVLRGVEPYGESVHRIAEHLGIPPQDNYHPPTSVILTSPLSLLRYDAASIVFGLILVLCYIFVVNTSLRCAGVRNGPLLFTLSLLWYPFYLGMTYANTALIVVTLIVFAAVMLERRPRLGGTLLGVATLLKLYPALLALLLLLQHRYKAFAWMSVTVMGVVIMSLPMIPLGSHVTYFTEIVRQNIATFGSSPVNISLTGSVRPLFLENPEVMHIAHVPWMADTLPHLLSLVVLWFSFRGLRRAEALKAVAVVSTTILIVTPTVWTHTLPLCLLPLALLWRENRYRAVVIATLLVFSLPLHSIVGALSEHGVTKLTPPAFLLTRVHTIILLAILILLTKKGRSPEAGSAPSFYVERKTMLQGT